MLSLIDTDVMIDLSHGSRRFAHCQIDAAHFHGRVIRRSAFAVDDAPLRPCASPVHQLFVEDQLPIPPVQCEIGKRTD